MHFSQDPSESTGPNIRTTFSALIIIALGCAALVLIYALQTLRSNEAAINQLPQPIGPIALNVSSTHTDMTYVGVAACRECHQDEYERWRGSHHDLAMKPADPLHVVGNFDNTSVTIHGVTSTFTKNDEGYFVRTENNNGELTDFRVLYTFGIFPLQQYLVEFPAGRLQTLPLCWDDRAADEGGQRWYHLYGHEPIPAGDELFWTGPNMNWNNTCAECHSTNLRKNFDPINKQFRTSFSEVNVACEACHGPGSEHLAWAKDKPLDARYDPNTMKGLAVKLKDLSGGFWQFDEKKNNYVRTKPLDSRVQLDTCARCHSRRSPLTEDYHHGASIHDTHRVSTLEPPLYELDGTIRDEVYVHGSFIQSKMHHAGVRCVDCHDAHSLKLHRPGNRLCTHCHQADYDSPAHHFHPAGGAGTLCIECHMPERTYMGIDKRSDHSFRIPRPDLSVKLDIPNTCNDCHSDQTYAWSLEHVKKWYGSRPQNEPPHYAEVLQAVSNQHPDAALMLPLYLADPNNPPIYRATLWRQSAPYMSQNLALAFSLAVKDPDPLVRAAAIQASISWVPRHAWAEISPLLSDPIRLVRIDAARRLAPIVPQVQPGSPGLPEFAKAWEEYEHSVDINRDRASAMVDLGTVQALSGNINVAVEELKQALALEPWYLPASINLADMYRELDRNQEASETIEAALKISPNAPVLHYAYGLAQVRRGNTEAAISSLSKAAELAPDDPQFSYAYAVSLNSTQQQDRALQVLSDALKRRPYDRSMLLAATLFSRDKGDRDQTLKWLEQLLKWWPNDPQARQLAAELRLTN